MERLDFNGISDLGSFLYELSSNEASVTTAVLFYDEAQELLRKLLQYENVNIGHINFSHEDYGYSKEYYITLDSDLYLDIEPAYEDDGYSYIDTDVMLLDGDANSRIAIMNDNCLRFEIVFEDDYEHDIKGFISLSF